MVQPLEELGLIVRPLALALGPAHGPRLKFDFLDGYLGVVHMLVSAAITKFEVIQSFRDYSARSEIFRRWL